MIKKLYLTLVHGVKKYDDYFVMKKGCTRMVVFSSVRNCIVAMRVLAYGAPKDSKHEYLRRA
jgi:hypothetical protein